MTKTREQEKRSFEVREQYHMDYSNPLNVPDSYKKPGFDYIWGRRKIKDTDDYRVGELLRKGWTLVPADRDPNYINVDAFGTDPVSSKYICFKDVILMERDSVFLDREKAKFNQHNREKVRSLSGVTNDSGLISNQRNHSINSFT